MRNRAYSFAANPLRDKTLPAAYVRMSTEHQRYSTENQLDTILLYASEHSLEIVQVYTDSGKSRLRLEGRHALTQLLDDVESGRAIFATILVYDVSRWGRFQDPDVSASYEVRCREAGVSVHYCGQLLVGGMDMAPDPYLHRQEEPTLVGPTAPGYLRKRFAELVS
jgi:hypothetical protein